MTIRPCTSRGIAAIELALALPLLLAVIAATVFFGGTLMSYAVAQRAAHSAAVYLSTAPLADLNDRRRAAETLDMANQLLDLALAEVRDERGRTVTHQIRCDGMLCQGMSGAPVSVEVAVDITLFDALLPDWTADAIGSRPLIVRAAVEARYIGK